MAHKSAESMVVEIPSGQDCVLVSTYVDGILELLCSFSAGDEDVRESTLSMLFLLVKASGTTSLLERTSFEKLLAMTSMESLQEKEGKLREKLLGARNSCFASFVESMCFPFHKITSNVQQDESRDAGGLLLSLSAQTNGMQVL